VFIPERVDGELRDMGDGTTVVAPVVYQTPLDATRRRWFAIGSKQGMRGHDLVAFVMRSMRKKIAIEYQGAQITLPAETSLLW
jgi:hypothetical protein